MGDSVKQIVDSIRKHSNFKRLAVYSIQSLCKKCTPPSNGWQQNAIEAFDCGATEAISEVIGKNASDAELFLTGLVQLQACAVAGSAAGLLTNGSLAAIVKAFLTYFNQASLPPASDAVRDGLLAGGVYRATGKDAEGVAVTESFLRLATYVALQARSEAASGSVGIIPCLISLLPRLPTPACIRLVLTALESLGRSATGVQSLASAEHAHALLLASAQLFGVEAAPSGITSPTGASTRMQRIALASGSQGGVSPAHGGRAGGPSRRTLAQLNGHLDPAFRLLDRMSRDDQGLKSLRESKAVSSLAFAVEWAQGMAVAVGSGGIGKGGPAAGLDPAVGATGVRFLARVQGNDFSVLISRIASACNGGNKSEGDFSASLLASLASDADVANKLAGQQADKAILTELVGLLALNGGSCCSNKAAAALCTALKRIAGHGVECSTSLCGAGAIETLLGTARQMAGQGAGSPSAAAALAEALSALADVLSSPEEVQVADAGGSGAAFLLGVLSERGSSHPDCAAAALAVLHAYQCHGYDQAALNAGKIIQLTAAAMSSEAGELHMELQMAGSAVLCECALGGRYVGGEERPSQQVDAAAVEAITAAGVLPVLVSNLDYSARAQPGPGSGTRGAFSAGVTTRLLATSSAAIGRPSLATAHVKVPQRLSLHAASQVVEPSAVGAVDGGEESSASLLGSHPASPSLAALSMHALHLLCSGPQAATTAAAKSAGMVRAMLHAYGRHGGSDAVHDAFTDLVEGCIGEAELTQAVVEVAKDTALLRDIMAGVDPAMISIAENDLGKEGLIAAGTGGAVSISAADEHDGEGAHAPAPAPVQVKAAGEGGVKELPGAVAARIAEALCLLQASTCSARLSALLVHATGVPVLIRTMGIVAVIKAKADGQKGHGRAGKGKAVVLQTGGGNRGGADPEAERTLPESLQDEVLIRCCSTITGLARIAIEWPGGTLGLDPLPTSISSAQGISISSDGRAAVPAARASGGGAVGGGMSAGHRRQRSGKTAGDVLASTQAAIAASLYRPVVSRILIKTINGRVNLPGACAAASVCLGVLSLGKARGGYAGLGDSSALLDTILAQGGVEAIVGGMRAHPALLPALQAVSNALCCVAIIGRGVDEARGVLKLPAPAETVGSAAVATRGATREILRALQNASAAANGAGSRWSSVSGQASLCSLLRVLLVIAETSKGADLLRKQGTVDALIATLDSGSGFTDGPASESSSDKGDSRGGEKEGAGSGPSVASALAGDIFGGALYSITDGASPGAVMSGDPSSSSLSPSAMGGQGPEATELIMAVLARLMDGKDLAEAVRTVAACADKISGGTLKVAGIQLCKLALTTIYSLAGKDNGLKAGAALWVQAAQAVSRLVTSLSAAGDALIAKASAIDAVKLEVACRSAQLLLPLASGTLAAISASHPLLDLGSEGAGEGHGQPQWREAISTAQVALLACMEIACAVRVQAASRKSTPTPAVKALMDRLASSYRSSLWECMAGAESMLQHDSAAGEALLSMAAGAGEAPLSGLVRVHSKLVEEGDAEGVSRAVSLLYTVSKVPLPGQGADGAVAMVLACQPPVQGMLLTSITELVQATGSVSIAQGTGCALLLLARMTHMQPALAAQLRSAGISAEMQRCMQRFCSAPAVAEDMAASARDVEGLGIARVLEGAALLQSQLAGRVSAGKGAGKGGQGDMEAHQSDIGLLGRILSLIKDEPAQAFLYGAPKAMTAVAELISAACVKSDGSSSSGAGTGRAVPEEWATAARDICTALDARGMLVMAMSGPRADARLLKAGARALAALGGGTGTGAALDVRRCVTRLRRAVRMGGVQGLLPEADPAFVPDQSQASPSATLEVGTPLLMSPTGSMGSAGGEGGAAADLLAACETSIRGLGAALAGEVSLTAAATRYVYDTILAALATSTACHAAVQTGRLSVEVPAALTGLAPGTSAAGAGMGGGNSRKSVRVSMAHTRATSGSERLSPEKESSTPSLRSVEAAQSAFMQQCESVSTACMQCLVRMLSPTLMPNPAPQAVKGEAKAELTAALSFLGPVAVWDATAEECERLGDPRGTASHSITAQAQASARAATGGAWPADTDASCPVVGAVSAGDLVDALLLAMGVGGHMGTVSAQGYILTAPVATSIDKAVEGIIEAVSKKQGSLSMPLDVNKHPCFTSVASCEFAWACACRGLVHLLTSALLVGQAATDNMVLPVITPSAASRNNASIARELCGVILESASGPILRSCLSRILALVCSQDGQVVRLLAMAATGGISSPSASSKREAVQLGFHACATPSGPPAAPVSVFSQLLVGAEGLTRPMDADLERQLMEYNSKQEGDGNDYEQGIHILRSCTSGVELQKLAELIVSPPGFSLPASPAWLVWVQATDMSTEGGGLPRLVHAGEVPQASTPLRAGSLCYLRVMAELLSSMHSCCGAGHAQGQGSDESMSKDSVVLPAGLGQTAALLALWAAASITTVDSEEEERPDLGMDLLAPAPVPPPGTGRVGHASTMSMPPSLANRKPGQRASVRPLSSIQEKRSGEGAGMGAHSAPAAARKSMRSHGRGVSSVSFALDAPVQQRPVMDLYIAAAHAVVYGSVRVLAHMDLGCTLPVAASDPITPASSPASSSLTPSGAQVTDLPSLLSDDACLSLYRSAVRQPGASSLASAGVQVLRRTLGLRSSQDVPPKASSERLLAQVEALAVGGVFARVCLALGLHTDSHEYAREVCRLLDDLGRCLAARAQGEGSQYTGSLLKGSMALTGGCLKALQGTVKRLGKDEHDGVISTLGERIVSCLGDVFSGVSGKGFLDALAKACRASEECPVMKLTKSDGAVVYAKKSKSIVSSPTAATLDSYSGDSEAPEAYTAMLHALHALHKVSRNLEPEAVPVVQADTLKQMVSSMQHQMLDAHTSAIWAWALARCCENIGNHMELMGSSGAVEAMVSLVPMHKGDVEVAEAIASAFRPLTIGVSAVQTLKRKPVIPALVSLLCAHVRTLIPRHLGYAEMSLEGGGAQAKEERARAHRALMKKLMSPTAKQSGEAAATSSSTGSGSSEAESADAAPHASTTTTSTDPKDLEPRIAHYAVQCLANISCDNVPDDPSSIPSYASVAQHLTSACPGGVARVVAAGGIDAIVQVMQAHLDRARVLEDSLCALSNIAYSCDGVRKLIGGTSSSLIVDALRVFNADPRTFAMALRAVGNLTRCDENIVAVVGSGVMRGIAEGMEKNKGNTDVLKIAADVVNNLASIDEGALDGSAQLAKLKQTMENKEDGKASAARLATVTSLQDGVATLLMDDGAHMSLVAAMTTHSTHVTLIQGCLRSCEYLTETRELVDRAEKEAGLGKAVCLVMRSCDFDADVIVRGARLLGQMLKHEGSTAKAGAMEAGAPYVLLSALETHKLSADVCGVVLKVLLSSISSEDAVLSAAKELNTTATLCTLLDMAGTVVAGKAQEGHSQEGDAAMAGTSVNTISQLVPEKASILARQVLLCLATWAGKDAILAGKLSGLIGQVCVAMLNPPAPKHEHAAGHDLYKDGSLMEAAFAVLAPVSSTSPACAEALTRFGEGGVLQLLRPMPTQAVLIDRQVLVEHALTVLHSIARASSPCAWLACTMNCHALCQAVALHWALKAGQEEATRKAVYDRAGQVLSALDASCVAARRERLSASALPEGAAGGREQDGRPHECNLTLGSLHGGDKLYQQAVVSRAKEAEKLAAKMGTDMASMLEDRAGLIPWSLVLTSLSLLDRMAGGQVDKAGRPSDLPVNVWFLPGMAPTGVQPKAKLRPMRVTLSEDLRVLTYAYTSKRVNRVIDWSLPLASVLHVRPGVPAPETVTALKKPLLAFRGPSTQLGIVCESASQPLWHVEAGSIEEHDRLLRVLSLLVQYNRARDGEVLPLHDLPDAATASAGVPSPGQQTVVDYAGEGVKTAVALGAAGSAQVEQVPGGSPPAPKA